MALQGNHDRWDKDKLPEDTAYISTSANSRGDLLATSSTLPTTVQNNVQIPVTWTTPAGSSLSVNASDSARLDEPYLRGTDAQLGYWIVAEIGGTEESEFLFPFNARQRAIFTPGGMEIYWQPLDSGNTYELRGRSATVAQNTVIKVYSAINSPGITGTIDTDQIADEAVTYDKLGSSRGRLIGTSSALPTASQTLHAALTGYTWTSSAPFGNTGVNFNIPRLSQGRRGLWVVAEINGSEVSDLFLPWGWSGLNNENELWLSLTQSIFIEEEVSRASANGAILHILGGGSTIPSNTVVKIYEG